ncbi:translation initiation factor IF-2-like [Schistocerca nitens]|uniref:translation initiation factor IF-2-like n=1 Tax=Schistocerca nitens TaxID=7011 RepID=UPI002118EB10|nr:translation initiation factor IF-2-like [Schistocerca nitens]
MTRLVVAVLCATAAAALAAAAQPPAPQSPRYKDFYHSYTLRQQLESQETFSGRGAGGGAGGQRGLPTGPGAPSAPGTAPGAASAAAAAAVSAPGTAPAAAASAPAVTEAPTPTATRAPSLKPAAGALSPMQIADAQQRASSYRELPVYYHAYPYYGYGGWPAMAPAMMPHPAWGRQAGPSPRVVGVVAGHHGGYFLHPGLYGAHHGGAILGPHGLVAHHGGKIKGLHGLAAHHGGIVKGLHGLAAHHGGLYKNFRGGLVEHHGGLLKGHHGLAQHHGGLVKTPLGLLSKHGGGLLLHARDAAASQQTPAGGQPAAQEPLYSARSAVPQQYPAYGMYQPHYFGWKSGQGKKGGGAAPPPLPAMPGKIKGGADVALFNAHGHGSQKGLQGSTAHKYKHYNLDVGYGCPPRAHPLHLMHTDAGYDVSHYTVGGAASAGAGVAHGLGGTFGLL